jgi:hypothetical protein
MYIRGRKQAIFPRFSRFGRNLVAHFTVGYGAEIRLSLLIAITGHLIDHNRGFNRHIRPYLVDNRLINSAIPRPLSARSTRAECRST